MQFTIFNSGKYKSLKIKYRELKAKYKDLLTRADQTSEVG